MEWKLRTMERLMKRAERRLMGCLREDGAAGGAYFFTGAAGAGSRWTETFKGRRWPVPSAK
jgi:hypothetical protein